MCRADADTHVCAHVCIGEGREKNHRTTKFCNASGGDRCHTGGLAGVGQGAAQGAALWARLYWEAVSEPRPEVDLQVQAHKQLRWVWLEGPWGGVEGKKRVGQGPVGPAGHR